jgi:tetratricopeptide (TPR) repeat protein
MFQQATFAMPLRWLSCCAALALVAASLPCRAKAQAPASPAAAVAMLIRAGSLDDAVQEATRDLKAHPNDPSLYTVEGIALSMQRKNADALEAFRTALRISPDFLPALRAESQVLSRENAPNVEMVLAHILRLDPSDGTAREMLALFQAKSGNCKSAIADFALVAQQTRTHAASLEHEATCMFEQQDYTGASDAFQQLLQLEPNNVDARYDLALAQRSAGDNKQAAETLKPLLSTADYDTLVLGSDISEDIGDTPDAVSLMRRAILLDPTRPDPYVRFAELCLLHESYDSGVAVVTAGLERLPNSPSLYLARGMLYGGEAKYDKAEADFRSAERLDPLHGTGAYGVGLIEAQSNHSAQALATARAALVAHPKDAQLNYLLARILMDEGATPGSAQFREAMRAATNAVRFNPNLLSAHDLLAKIDGMDGHTAEVVKQCKEALRIDPSDQNAMYRLMRAAKETGDRATERGLIQHLEELHKQARSDETKRLRYRIAVAPTPETSKEGER